MKQHYAPSLGRLFGPESLCHERVRFCVGWELNISPVMCLSPSEFVSTVNKRQKLITFLPIIRNEGSMFILYYFILYTYYQVYWLLCHVLLWPNFRSSETSVYPRNGVAISGAVSHKGYAVFAYVLLMDYRL